MISADLRERVRAQAEKNRQRELDLLEMLGKVIISVQGDKPKIRVKATFYRWEVPNTPEVAGGIE